jgi:hypothetical protein
MLNQARPYFQSHPHLMIFPGITITFAVLAFNVIGDGLRDALDPKTRALVVAARRGSPRWRRLFRRRATLQPGRGQGAL